MVDDQQLWGYREVAAHLRISVRAARSRKSRGSLPAPDASPCRTGPAGSPPPFRAGGPSAEGFGGTCTAPPSARSFPLADRHSCPPVGCDHDVRLTDAVPTVPFARQRSAPGGRRQRHRIGPQRRSLGRGGDPACGRPRLVRGACPGRGRVPRLRLPGRAAEERLSRLTARQVSRHRVKEPTSTLGRPLSRAPSPLHAPAPSGPTRYRLSSDSMTSPHDDKDRPAPHALNDGMDGNDRR